MYNEVADEPNFYNITSVVTSKLFDFNFSSQKKQNDFPCSELVLIVVLCSDLAF